VNNTHYSALQLQTLDEVTRCIQLCERRFERTFSVDGILFNLRGRSAGQFRVKHLNGKWIRELRFNQQLLDQHTFDFIDDTVPHEVAHFIVYELFGTSVRPHGKEWQYVMREVLDQTPEVTHKYDVQPARKMQTVAYTCGCPERVHQLGLVRHKRVITQQARYLCRQCREPLLPSQYN